MLLILHAHTRAHIYKLIDRQIHTHSHILMQTRMCDEVTVVSRNYCILSFIKRSANELLPLPLLAPL